MDDRRNSFRKKWMEKKHTKKWKYKSLHREVHKMYDNAKEERISKNCVEIEKLVAQHKSSQIYEKVKEV